MAQLWNKLSDGYKYIFTDIADPRTQHYPLVASPIPLLIIVGSYLYFVLKLGPKLMEKRKPFKLEKILIVFNISQILACGWLVWKFMEHCFFIFNWRCEPINYSDEPYPNIIAFYTWMYYVIKLLDLLDTVFFVLRKKFNQVTFLHVYHHTGMAIMMWVGTKYVAGGSGLLIGFANCIVHCFMYFYYLISIYDDKYKKSIWWKKYITQLQMAQFGFLAVLFFQILLQPDCQYPKWIAIVFLPQNALMMILFFDFYRKAYMRKKSEEVKQNGNSTVTNNKEKVN